MKPILPILAFAVLANIAAADPLPKSVASAPCTVPPTIDGILAPDEWKSAKHYSFDLEMIRLKPMAKENRACELWLMNSANALYIAFRIPDETLNASLNPIDIDFAVLAF
ncbi:MAG TPA: hypothetical protein VHR66_28485 [Gemmataceae bacterium]|nr:hypothetical protein [Gemmataceae bacterium]